MWNSKIRSKTTKRIKQSTDNRCDRSLPCEYLWFCSTESRTNPPIFQVHLRPLCCWVNSSWSYLILQEGAVLSVMAYPTEINFLSFYLLSSLHTIYTFWCNLNKYMNSCCQPDFNVNSQPTWVNSHQLFVLTTGYYAAFAWKKKLICFKLQVSYWQQNHLC